MEPRNCIRGKEPGQRHPRPGVREVSMEPETGFGERGRLRWDHSKPLQLVSMEPRNWFRGKWGELAQLPSGGAVSMEPRIWFRGKQDIYRAINSFTESQWSPESG